MTVEVFQNVADAAEAGYLLRLPPTEEYRRWLIITDYVGGRVRMVGREISGRRVMPDTPPPSGIRVSIAGRMKRVRGGGTFRDGSIMQFRFVTLPRGAQPEESIIRIVGRVSRVGTPDELCRYATRAEWLRARDELRRLIDIRIDGRANIDLIED